MPRPWGRCTVHARLPELRGCLHSAGACLHTPGTQPERPALLLCWVRHEPCITGGAPNAPGAVLGQRLVTYTIMYNRLHIVSCFLCLILYRQSLMASITTFIIAPAWIWKALVLHQRLSPVGLVLSSQPQPSIITASRPPWGPKSLTSTGVIYRHWRHCLPLVPAGGRVLGGGHQRRQPRGRPQHAGLRGHHAAQPLEVAGPEDGRQPGGLDWDWGWGWGWG